MHNAQLLMLKFGQKLTMSLGAKLQILESGLVNSGQELEGEPDESLNKSAIEKNQNQQQNDDE